MKELEHIPKVQQAEYRQVKQEYRFIGSMRYRKSLKLYSFDPTAPVDMDNLREEQVQVRERVAIKKDKPDMIIPKARYSPTERKVSHDPRLVYIQALNTKTALKKAQKYQDRFAGK